MRLEVLQPGVADLRPVEGELDELVLAREVGQTGVGDLGPIEYEGSSSPQAREMGQAGVRDRRAREPQVAQLS